MEDARRAQKLNASRQAPRPAPTPEEMRRRADEQCVCHPLTFHPRSECSSVCCPCFALSERPLSR